MNSLAAESFPKEYSLGNHNAICWEIMEVQHHELLFNYCNTDVEVPAAGDQLKNNLFALCNLHNNFQTTNWNFNYWYSVSLGHKVTEVHNKYCSSMLQ